MPSNGKVKVLEPCRKRLHFTGKTCFNVTNAGFSRNLPPFCYSCFPSQLANHGRLVVIDPFSICNSSMGRRKSMETLGFRTPNAGASVPLTERFWQFSPVGQKLALEIFNSNYVVRWLLDFLFITVPVTCFLFCTSVLLHCSISPFSYTNLKLRFSVTKY